MPLPSVGMTVDAACEEALRVFGRLRRQESYQLTIAVAFGVLSGATPLESCVAAERFEGAGLREFALADTIGSGA